MTNDLVAAKNHPPARCPACCPACLLVYGETRAETECLSCGGLTPTDRIVNGEVFRRCRQSAALNSRR